MHTHIYIYIGDLFQQWIYKYSGWHYSGTSLLFVGVNDHFTDCTQLSIVLVLCIEQDVGQEVSDFHPLIPGDACYMLLLNTGITVARFTLTPSIVLVLVVQWETSTAPYKYTWPCTVYMYDLVQWICMTLYSEYVWPCTVYMYDLVEGICFVHWPWGACPTCGSGNTAAPCSGSVSECECVPRQPLWSLYSPSRLLSPVFGSWSERGGGRLGECDQLSLCTTFISGFHDTWGWTREECPKRRETKNHSLCKKNNPLYFI